MKRTELWMIYVRRNPSFETQATITLTTAGLKKLFDQTYTQAYDQGYDDATEVATKKESLFGKIFG